MDDYKRSHDNLYLDSAAEDEPKYSFVRAAELISTFHAESRGKKILDVGCAVGHFPNYLQGRFPRANVVGLEYLPSLVSQGKEFFPDLDLRTGSILNSSMFEKETFDTVTVMGVLQIFDDPKVVLQNVFGWLKGSGSQLIIHGLFNEFDVDVFVKYRGSGEENTQVGWNIFSMKTIRTIAAECDAKSVKFHAFELPFDLEKRENDPLRSWTERASDGSRTITNALHIRQPQFIAEITR